MATARRAAARLADWRGLLSVAASLLLGACASIAPGGRAQLTVPTPVSSLYSSLDMPFQLATATPIPSPCVGVQCRVDKGLDQQVSRLGARLARAAYAADPGLEARVPAFKFLVADISDPGSMSDAQGTVIVYRGVRTPALNEGSLAFLIAVEMGHVMARHHDEKAATGILLSLATQVFLPWTSLSGGFAALAGSVASAAGTKMITADKVAAQRDEAEAIARDLLARQNWNGKEIAASLRLYRNGLRDGDSAWAHGVTQSLVRLEQAAPATVLVAWNQHDIEAKERWLP